MKKYTTYKPSGVEWIEEIPEHWGVKKLKYLTNVKGSNVDKLIYENENQVFLCNYTDVYKNEYINDGIVFTKGSCSNEELNKFILKKGDVIITKDSETPDDIGIPSYVCKDFTDVVCGYHLSMISPKPNDLMGQYLFRQLQTKRIKSYFEVNSNGITRYGLGKSSIENLDVITPPITEQHQIVQFLDEKTEIINKLISTKESKIDLLKEQRTSLISQVITKGLDPNVKMKDSGVEWIGEIPEHWEKRRVSNFGVFFKGSGIKKDEVKEEGFPCIRYGEIYTKYNRVVYEPVSFIDEETSKYSVLIKKGDVLFTGSGETMEDIGKTIVYYGEKDVFVGGDIIVLRLNNGLNPLYMSYLMNTNFVQYQKSLSGKGEIIVHIYSKNIKEIITPLPPQNEQQQIVEFLDKRTKEIDDLMTLEQKKIETLKEYRQSLISEVITGKIDVRTNVN